MPKSSKDIEETPRSVTGNPEIRSPADSRPGQADPERGHARPLRHGFIGGAARENVNLI